MVSNRRPLRRPRMVTSGLAAVVVGTLFVLPPRFTTGRRFVPRRSSSARPSARRLPRR